MSTRRRIFRPAVTASVAVAAASAAGFLVHRAPVRGRHPGARRPAQARSAGRGRHRSRPACPAGERCLRPGRAVSGGCRCRRGCGAPSYAPGRDGAPHRERGAAELPGCRRRRGGGGSGRRRACPGPGRPPPGPRATTPRAAVETDAARRAGPCSVALARAGEQKARSLTRDQGLRQAEAALSQARTDERLARIEADRYRGLVQQARRLSRRWTARRPPSTPQRPAA